MATKRRSGVEGWEAPGLRPSEQAWLLARVVELGRAMEELKAEATRLRLVAEALEERVTWLEGADER